MRRDGPATDGRGEGGLYPAAPPDFFPRCVISLPVLNVRSSLRYNEPASEHTSSQMSTFRSPHWGNCKHKSSKVYNFGGLVFGFCPFSSAKAFLRRQTLRSFITRSLVWWNNGAGRCVRVPAVFAVTVRRGQAAIWSPASLIPHQTAELTWATPCG